MLFLICVHYYTIYSAYMNMKSFRIFFNDNGEKIKSFRTNKRGNPSVQTKLKLISIDDPSCKVLRICRNAYKIKIISRIAA